ncbi:MAG: hypothetical protein IKH51_01745 [Clostridia bacterium]|nr:hypothetical protein [Clostridia bacterium]
MLLSDIYNTAAALISEQPDGADNADLSSRAVYLLFQIISELTPLDRAASSEDREYPDTVNSLDEAFPLCDGLAHICAYKLAYLLIADEDTTLYSVLRAEYENAKKRFIDSLPASISGIKNVYP